MGNSQYLHNVFTGPWWLSAVLPLIWNGCDCSSVSFLTTGLNRKWASTGVTTLKHQHSNKSHSCWLAYVRHSLLGRKYCNAMNYSKTTMFNSIKNDSTCVLEYWVGSTEPKFMEVTSQNHVSSGTDWCTRRKLKIGMIYSEIWYIYVIQKFGIDMYYSLGWYLTRNCGNI